MFQPVELIHPGTGRRYTARDAVDLNDRLAEGYTRPIQVPARPSTVAPVSYSYLSDDVDENDIESV